jgi:Domain of unknown function (DUF4129)
MAFWLVQAAGTPHWAPRAVQDTVAAIARGAEYQRAYTASLFQRLLAWLGMWWGRILSPLGRVPHLSQILLGLGILFALLVAARMLVNARRAKDVRDRLTGGRESGETADPWRDAQALAAAGEFTGAAHALYRALIVRLSARGGVRLHPSKTAGDYARELRRRNVPDQAPFQAFRVRYDRLIYGAGSCDAADYAALLHEARPILDRAA